MNSLGSRTSCCHSSSCLSHTKYCSSALAPTRPSLYFQCAAMPYSATWCIRSERICTSNGEAAIADDRGVQRLVGVGTRHGDEVLETSRHRRPRLVDDAQRGIAVADGGRDHAQCDDVVDLLELDLLALEFLPDAEQALQASVDGDHGDGGFVETLGEGLPEVTHGLFGTLAPAPPSRCSASRTPPAPGSGTQDPPVPA